MSKDAMNPLLTIGMANFSDSQGVWWTLSDIRLHHVGPNDGRVELLVVDDTPESDPELEHACQLAKARYLHLPAGRGPAAAKNLIWDHASGGHVLMVDCHVLLGQGCVSHLVAAAEHDLVGADMWVGILLDEAGSVIATELEPVLRGNFLGVWKIGDFSVTREIEAHGGAFAFMKRSNWPGFHSGFTGFGGEEFHIHERVRMAGGKVLLQPELQWVHRFSRFGPVPYPLHLPDRFRNYLLAAREAGWSIKQFRDYFAKSLSEAEMIQVELEVTQLIPGIFDNAISDGRRFPEFD